MSFPALKDAKTGVTIEVTDNNGKAVEVKPVDLVKGETVAVFTFEKSLTEAPKGVWTVAGIKVDLDLKAKLEAVYTAGDQVKLLAALNKLGVTDVKEENVAQYVTELNKLKDTTKTTYVELTDFTKEDAQAVVKAGNEEAEKAGNEETIVKAVIDAKTQPALLTALSSFERVNSDWIADYQTAINGATDANKDTVKEIQALVDGVNAPKLTTTTTGITTNITKDDLTKAKSLVDAYQVPDAEGETAKADLLKAIDRQLAIVDVLAAETPAQLSVAYNNLVKYDGAYELDKDTFIDANRAEYVKALDATSGDNFPFNTIAKIQAEIVKVNGEQASAPITKVIEDGNFAVASAATNKAALLKALQAVPGLKYVAEDNAQAYAELADTTTTTVNAFGKLAFTTETPAQKLAAVQALVDTANLNAIKSTSNTADTLYKALVAYGNNIKDINVANKSNYFTTANGNFAEVTNTATIQTAVDEANIKAVQAQTTAEGVLAKLQIITQLKDVKPEYAKAYLASVKASATATTDLGHADNDTVGEIQTVITNVNTAEAEKATIAALNKATTAEAVRDALTEIALNNTSDFEKYINLKAADKLIVADLFLDDEAVLELKTSARVKELTKYDTVANVKADAETVLATKVAAVPATVNVLFVDAGTQKIPTNGGVQAVLAGLVDYGYEGYESATATEKLNIAEAFIANYPKNDKGEYVANSYNSLTAVIEAVEKAATK